MNHGITYASDLHAIRKRKELAKLMDEIYEHLKRNKGDKFTIYDIMKKFNVGYYKSSALLRLLVGLRGIKSSKNLRKRFWYEDSGS